MGDHNGQYKETDDEIESRQETRHDTQESRKTSHSQENKKSAKSDAAKTRRTGVSKRIKARQPKRGATPVVEETVIDVVDEPLPGVVRLTEIEEMEVSVPELRGGGIKGA